MKLKHQMLFFIFIFIFLALHEASFSLARRVKKVNAVTPEKEMAVEGEGVFSLQEETEASAEENGGRKIRGEEIKGRSSRRAWESAGNRNGGGDEKEENLMAFSSDYHPPKSHPPKNN